MKIFTLLGAILVGHTLFAQTPVSTSFEEPGVFNTDYTDTGDPTMAHDLINNPNEPFVNFPETNDEIGYSARYEPYDSPGVGLTDGDSVGVTEDAPATNPFQFGTQGYQISDVDGNFILEFDPIVSYADDQNLIISYFITETGYEGDGTTNTSGSDRLRIYVKFLEENEEYDVLDTTGQNINDMGIEGQWIVGSANLPAIQDVAHTFQLVIEGRNNSSAEAYYFDNIYFSPLLANDDFKINHFVVYPNPASTSFINISSKNGGPKTITVYDILGKMVKHSVIVNDKLNISKLTSGIYMLKVTQGNESAIKKLVVN